MSCVVYTRERTPGFTLGYIWSPQCWFTTWWYSGKSVSKWRMAFVEPSILVWP